MICEVNDKRVLIFGSWASIHGCAMSCFSGDGWRIYWMEMEYVDEYYFLELDLLDRVYGEVFV